MGKGRFCCGSAEKEWRFLYLSGWDRRRMGGGLSRQSHVDCFKKRVFWVLQKTPNAGLNEYRTLWHIKCGGQIFPPTAFLSYRRMAVSCQGRYSCSSNGTIIAFKGPFVFKSRPWLNGENML